MRYVIISCAMCCARQTNCVTKMHQARQTERRIYITLHWSLLKRKVSGTFTLYSYKPASSIMTLSVTTAHSDWATVSVSARATSKSSTLWAANCCCCFCSSNTHLFKTGRVAPVTMAAGDVVCASLDAGFLCVKTLVIERHFHLHCSQRRKMMKDE